MLDQLWLNTEIFLPLVNELQDEVLAQEPECKRALPCFNPPTPALRYPCLKHQSFKTEARMTSSMEIEQNSKDIEFSYVSSDLEFTS